MATISTLAISWSDLEVAAQTVFGEARGEPAEGLIAVAWVLFNRALRPAWWGGPSLYSVCLKPHQFSCWNKDDPNRRVILAATPADLVMRRCLAVVIDILEGRAPDPTDGSDHYCAITLHPAWVAEHKPQAIIGGHKFYRLGPHGDGL